METKNELYESFLRADETKILILNISESGYFIAGENDK